MNQTEKYRPEAECAVREPKIMTIRSELESAVKRSDQALTRLETMAIGLLGNEPPLTLTAGSSTEDYGKQKVSLDPGSLEGLVERLRQLHYNMSAIEHQIDRLASDL